MSLRRYARSTLGPSFVVNLFDALRSSCKVDFVSGSITILVL
jgi:hypothetical protein